MPRRTRILTIAVGLVIGISAFTAPSQVSASLQAQPEAAPSTVSTITDVVAHEPPITIEFVGPARFAGVMFNQDGSVMTVHWWFGTIVPVEARTDRTQLVDGIPYARMMDGALAGLWTKVNRSLTRARGKAPRPPDCRYADLLTGRRSYNSHWKTLLDTIYRVEASYAPPDLRDSANYALNSGYEIRSIVGADLKAMTKAALAAGAPIQIVSGYRSHAQQQTTFNYWVSVSGYKQALLTSARPGHSEHQLGTTVDVTSRGGAAPWTYSDWGATTAGAWMKKHAWKYGFVMSYPKNRTAVTCYAYEPWHYRYVGKAVAAAVRASGTTLREAIWAAYGR